jgi:hypothetical protein
LISKLKFVCEFEEGRFLGEKWNFEKKSFNVDVLACVGG